MEKNSMEVINPVLTAEEIMGLEAAERRPVTPDDDCPEMTVSQLPAFKPFRQRTRDESLAHRCL